MDILGGGRFAGNFFRVEIFLSPYILLTVVIFKSRSTFFGLLRKSLRGKSKLKMRLILAIFGEFVRFFENSKNQKVQTLGGATFGDTPMY